MQKSDQKTLPRQIQNAATTTLVEHAHEMELAEEPAKVHLLCNKCLSVISSGQCFRTTLCQHLICETCAMQHFQNDCSCPVCGEMLNEDQLAEIVVGVEVQNVHASTFQAMFASPNWESLAMQTFSTIDLYRDQAGFVLTQLLLLNRQYEERCHRLEHDLAQAKHEKTQLVSANTGLEQKNKLIEHKLNAKDHELKQISECYKEKAVRREPHPFCPRHRARVRTRRAA